MTPGDTLSCGHPLSREPGSIAAGYATLANGSRVCYTCADDIQREAMRTESRVIAYLSSDASALTTWSGGMLARVTSKAVKRVGFRNVSGRRPERTYFTATDPTGKRWHGTSEGPGMLARMRASRA